MNTFIAQHLVFLMVSALILSSCLLPKQKRQMEEDIYRLQTKVLELESSSAQAKQTDQKLGESNKSLASTSSEVEKLNLELKRMKGDIDALRIGVQTGQMPGQEDAEQNSVAAQLADIKTRLEQVEVQQKDIISALEKGGAAGRKSNDKKPKGSSVASLDSLKTAFDRKRYKEVIEDAPNVLSRAKGRDREQVLMIYGESLLKLQRPKEAALQFNELVEMKPGDKNLAMAKLRLGDAFKAMGDKDTSKLFYEEVATKFAGTAEGEKAQKALKTKK
jgi:TolA-binding protein